MAVPSLKDIAFEFATWLSPAFKLYLIKEFQRLKEEENSVKKLDWDLQRTLSKINYRIHTDAIKETLIPPAITKEQIAAVYANGADMLNVALLGRLLNNGGNKIQLNPATFATTPRWSNWWYLPTWKAIMPS